MPVHRDLERSPTGGNKLQSANPLFETHQFDRQTGGLRFVVSGGAIFNRNLGAHVVIGSVGRGSAAVKMRRTRWTTARFDSGRERAILRAMRKVIVPLGPRSYRVVIGAGVLARLGEECRRLSLGRTCAIITDRNVARHFGALSKSSLERAGFRTRLLILPPGERSKSLPLAGWCYDRLAAARLDRQSFIVALGGGVVGDLAGFVAATYLRGVAFVQAPTTLLAQVDSSVGGKVGINLSAGKNLVGSFLQPRLVLADLDTLESLPAREIRAGLAEVIKYGIIYDRRLFGLLEHARLLQLDRTALEPIIARCCAIKAAIVAQDETEGGVRAILNFGHTVGHALEAASGYGQLLHGEAIAIGQVLAARLSEKVLGLPAEESGRIRNLFQAAGLPISFKPSKARIEKLLQSMRLDKKNRGGEIKFVLVRRIGEARFGCGIPERLLKETLQEAAIR